MTPPLVSLVTASFNQAEFLEEAMTSVLEQDYPNLEYLVVDGGSTDGSVDVIRGYEDRLAWWTSEPDAGQAAALNKGFARTRGAILGWLNSDDTLFPGAVSRLVDELERDPELLLAYGDAVYLDERSRRTGYLPSRPWEPEAMLRRCENHVVQPASLFRRRAWELAGPLDEAGWYLFDFEFFLRLSVHGGAVRVPEPLATYREHPGSKTMGDQLRKADDYMRFADSFLAGERLPGQLRPSARRGRSSAYIAAGDYYYWALDLPRARRTLWRALALSPRNASRRSVSLALKSLLPRPAVRALRARRGRRRTGGALRA